MVNTNWNNKMRIRTETCSLYSSSYLHMLLNNTVYAQVTMIKHLLCFAPANKKSIIKKNCCWFFSSVYLGVYMIQKVEFQGGILWYFHTNIDLGYLFGFIFFFWGGGGSEKWIVFGVWIFCVLGHHKIGLYLGVICILGSFLKVNEHNGFWVAKNFK